MSKDPELWQIVSPALDLPGAENMAATLEEWAIPPLAVSLVESQAESRAWRVEALYDSRPDVDALDRALGNHPPGPFLRVAPLAPRDWVRLSQAGLKAVTAGRFHVHAGHLPRHPSPAAIDLVIEAAQAFGSGQHETTRGCLLAIDRLARRKKYRNVLDLGTGSGVLALAAAKIWHTRVLASDIDPIATTIARENFRRHGVPHLEAVTATGLRHPAIAARAPFDLILANILARPLCRLAPALARRLAPGGTAVLSGLLDHQEAAVLAAYRMQGVRLRERIVLGPWHTLILERRG